MWFVKIRLCGTPIANHVHSPSSIFNSPFRSRKISAPSIDRTAPQCYNKVILKNEKGRSFIMKNPEKLLDLLAQDARLTPAQLAAMHGATKEEEAAAINA